MVPTPFSTSIVTSTKVRCAKTSDALTDGTMIAGRGHDRAERSPAKLAASGNELWIQGGTRQSLARLTRSRPSTPSARCAARPTTSTATTSMDRLPERPAAARLLLRLLRPAAARQRDDPRAQGAQRRARRDACPAVPLRGQHLLQPRATTSPSRRRGATQQTDFIRAAGTTWDFTEQASTSLALLDAIDCASRNGTSTFTTNVATRRTEVTATSGDSSPACTATATGRRRRAGPPQAQLRPVGTFDSRRGGGPL